MEQPRNALLEKLAEEEKIPTPPSVATSPTIEMSRPKSTAASLYSYSVKGPVSVTQKAIMDSGKRIEDLTQGELREVYFHIGAKLGSRIYSASAVNHIESKGIHPEADTPEESDSLFIGHEVHKAMEVKGANLHRLKTLDMYGTAPVKPDVSLSPDHWKMIELMTTTECSASCAYFQVKDNLMVKNTTLENLDAYEAGMHEDVGMTEEEIKNAKKLVEAAKKEEEKFKGDAFDRVKMYYKKLITYNASMDKFRSNPANLIIDDLPYRKSNPRSILEKINRSYSALSTNSFVMNTYHQLYEIPMPDVESHSEFVVLWKYEFNKRVVPCKSMFDRVHFDHANKLAVIIDIKTHSKRGSAFATTNYKDYMYYRSMAFYKDAVKYYIQEKFKNAEEWNVVAILMPVSTQTFEVGCHAPYNVISDLDLNMGTNGSFIYPERSIFNNDGYLEYALSSENFTKLEGLGLINNHSYDYYIKGWKKIIEDYELSHMVSMAM